MLSIKPMENGSAWVKFTPRDIPTDGSSTGTILTISDLEEIRWQLMYPNGQPVNNRTFENGLLTSLDWVIYGQDLAYLEGSVKRIIAIEYTFNSQLGLALPGRFEESFEINKLLSQQPST